MKNLKKLLQKENLRRTENNEPQLKNSDVSIAFFGENNPVRIHNLIERKTKNIPKGNFNKLCELLRCTLEELIY